MFSILNRLKYIIATEDKSIESINFLKDNVNCTIKSPITHIPMGEMIKAALLFLDNNIEACENEYQKYYYNVYLENQSLWRKELQI